jgi:hypothetical protein
MKSAKSGSAADERGVTLGEWARESLNQIAARLARSMRTEGQAPERSHTGCDTVPMRSPGSRAAPREHRFTRRYGERKTSR